MHIITHFFNAVVCNQIFNQRYSFLHACLVVVRRLGDASSDVASDCRLLQETVRLLVLVRSCLDGCLNLNIAGSFVFLLICILALASSHI